MTHDRIAGPLPGLTIERLIEEHGARRVLWAVLRAALRPPPPPRDAAALSDHLRRDIGLPPAAPPARIERPPF